MQHKAILAAILITILACNKSQAQALTDTAALRRAINTLITTNGTQQITAAKLNRILNGTLNVMPHGSLHVDTLYQRGDSLFYKKNGIEYFGAFTGGTPFITAPNSPQQYLNGYKQFVPINMDSIADGTSNFGWSASNISTGFGLGAFAALPGKYVSLYADTSTMATNANARRLADSAAAAVPTFSLPSQTGNSGKFLSTNGNSPSWATVSGGGGSTSPQYYGILYNKNTWTTTSDFTEDTATASVSSNKIVVTAGSGISSLDYNYYSLLDHWNTTAKIKATSTSAVAGVGTRSMNVYQKFSAYASLNFGTGALTIVATNNLGSPATTVVATSGSNLSISTNDYVLISLERVVDTLYATARDITTGSSFIIATYGLQSANYANASPNTGKYAVYAFSGSFTLDSLVISSKELVNANLLVTTDSKGEFNANSFSSGWTQQISALYYPTVISAGGSEGVRDVLNRVPEIIALAPKAVLLMIGRNDLNASYSNVYSDYDTIVARLTAAGITVYHSNGFYETAGLNLLPLKSHIEATFPGYVINTYDPSLQVPSVLYSDNVHPNQTGHNLIAQTIIQSGLIKKGLNYGEIVRFNTPPIAPYNYTPTNASGTAAGIVSLGVQTLGTGAKTMDQVISNSSFDLPNTTSNTVGVILQNGTPIYHQYNGNSNAFLGYNAGNFSFTNYNNTGIGNNALNQLTSGGNNAAFGTQALYLNQDGNFSAAVGAFAGKAQTTGDYNSFFGASAGQHSTNNNNNILIGYNAGINIYTAANGGGSASNNIMIGNNSGSNITFDGAYNVLIGHYALQNPSAVPNNKFCVTGGSSTYNLLFGDFNTGQLQVNAAQTSPALTASAAFEVVSTTRGLLPPRMTTSQRNAISSPVAGLTVYCSDCTASDASTGVMQTYNGSTWKNNW